jgi:hypothetical protein
MFRPTRCMAYADKQHYVNLAIWPDLGGFV